MAKMKFSKYTVRLPIPLRKDISKLAEADGRSLQGEVVALLKAAVDARTGA